MCVKDGTGIVTRPKDYGGVTLTQLTGPACLNYDDMVLKTGITTAKRVTQYFYGMTRSDQSLEIHSLEARVRLSNLLKMVMHDDDNF